MHAGTYTPGHTERAQAIASWIHECIVERMRAAGDRCPVSHENLQIFGFVHLESAFIAFEHCQCAPAASCNSTVDADVPLSRWRIRGSR